MKQSFLEPRIISGDQKTPHLLSDMWVHYREHKSPRVECGLRRHTLFLQAGVWLRWGQCYGQHWWQSRRMGREM